MDGVRDRRQDFKIIFGNIKRPGAAAMLEWLEESGFFEVPASSKYHGTHLAGLVAHSVNVWHRLREITCRDLLKDGPGKLWPDQEETVAILDLLHDVCKVGVYHQATKRRKNQDTGK